MLTAAGVAVLLVLTGCTGDSADEGRPADAGPSAVGQEPAAPSAIELARPAAEPQLIAGEDAQSAALRMSEALFGASPAVVIAAPDAADGAAPDAAAGGTAPESAPADGAGDGSAGPDTAPAPTEDDAGGDAEDDGGAAGGPADTLMAATAAAVELGVPLLLTGGADVRPELDRLGAATVVTFGEPEGGWQFLAEEHEIVEGPAGAESLEVEGAEDEAAALVLTLESEEPHLGAALATAEAAGAVVERLNHPDPRASAETIELLRAHEGKSLVALGAGFDADTFASHVNVALTSPELPGGGQLAFPGRRMVAMYGHPGTSGLGVLGEQGIDAAIDRAKDLAAQYEPYSDEPVIPAFEIITTVASSEAGPDGDYSTESTIEHIEGWVDAAQEAGVYVVLDLQPGHTDFLTQAKLYEELLLRPHVGLALDPEWRLGPDDQHMVQLGSVDAAEVNEVSAWLAELTRTNNLPQKVLILHQFSLSMITGRDQIETGHSEVAMVLHADGHGAPGSKLETYDALQQGLDEEIWMGWKNFYDEDSPTFSPERTYTGVDPKPWFVSYQ